MAARSAAVTDGPSPPSGSSPIVTYGIIAARSAGSAGSPTSGSITITPSSGTRSQMKPLREGGATTSARSSATAAPEAAPISAE